MRSRYGVKLASKYVRSIGQTTAPSDGIAMDSNGTLYYGQLGLNSVYGWDSESGSLCNQAQLLQDDMLDWPADISVLNDGSSSSSSSSNSTRLVLSNSQQKWAGKYDFCDINFRIFSL